MTGCPFCDPEPCDCEDSPGLPLDWDDVGEVPYGPARKTETVELS